MNRAGLMLCPQPMEIEMTCLCNLHKATNLTTGGLLTVSNSNNIANLMPFDMVLCLNPNNIITGAPVNYTITINGTVASLLNRFGLPISTDHLAPRKVYRGRYIIPVSGDPYVILLNTPCDIAYAVSSTAVAKEAESTTDGD